MEKVSYVRELIVEFFFQAEDGIRDADVTGVQTCALPILDVDFGRAGAPKGVWQYAAIHRESSIDLSGLPHSVVLPRLELFADSGYPFTAIPDLEIGRASCRERG